MSVRIRCWGGLDYFCDLRRMPDLEPEQALLVVRLDRPVIIPPEIVKNARSAFARVRRRPPHSDQEAVETMVGTWIRHGRLVDGPTKRLPRLFPPAFAWAFVGYEEIPEVKLGLGGFDRFLQGVPMPRGGYDLEILLTLTKPIRDPERFLKAFGRKLNERLATGRKIKKLLRQELRETRE